MQKPPKAQRPPTGPLRPRTLDEEVLEVPVVVGGLEEDEGLGGAMAPPGTNADTPTRQIDTKPIVSAAFEEEDPEDDLGFDRPLFGGDPEDEPTPPGFYGPQISAELSAHAGDRDDPSGESVVVAMDFDGPDEDTPVSLWARSGDTDTIPPSPREAPGGARGGLASGQRGSSVEGGSRRRSSRPGTGPQLPHERPRRLSGEISLPPLGSARRRDRPSVTGRLPRQSAGGGRGGRRIAFYLLLGGALGLGAGAYLWSSSPGRHPIATQRSSLSPAEGAALASVAHRRVLDERERLMLTIVLRRIAAGRFVEARRAFSGLPERLRRDVGVRSWLARIQRGEGEHAAAIETIRALLVRAPAASLRVELNVELGEAFLAAGKRKEALAAAETAKRELDADASEALAGRVLRLLKRCKRTSAP